MGTKAPTGGYIPGPEVAPKAPEERAAFLRAIDLAQHFSSLAWTLAEPPDPTAEGLAANLGVPVDDGFRAAAQEMAGAVIDPEDRAAARLEVEEAAKLLADVREPEHLIQDAIVRAVQRCVALPDPDPVMLSVGDGPSMPWRPYLSVQSSLAKLRQEYPVEGARIKDDTFAAAVEARREAVARKRAEYGSNEQDQWRAIADILEQAMPAFLRLRFPGADRRDRVAVAVERRNRRSRTGR